MQLIIYQNGCKTIGFSNGKGQSAKMNSVICLAIESAIVDSNTERENLRPLRSHAKLRIARKMTGNVDAVDRHARGPFSSWLLTDTKIPQHISITRGNDEFFKEK